MRDRIGGHESAKEVYKTRIHKDKELRLMAEESLNTTNTEEARSSVRPDRRKSDRKCQNHAKIRWRTDKQQATVFGKGKETRAAYPTRLGYAVDWRNETPTSDRSAIVVSRCWRCYFVHLRGL